MESYSNSSTYNNPFLFSCSLCGESQSKYLPPGTKMTGCGKCGNLINVSDLPKKKSGMTNSSNMNQRVSSFGNRRSPNQNQRQKSSNRYYDPYDYLNSNYEDHDNDNGYNEEGYGNNNRFNPLPYINTHNKKSNGNRQGQGHNGQQLQQQQEQQGMFSLHFPNENYNRFSSNARRFNQDRAEDEDDDEAYFDREIEREMNQMMQLNQLSLSYQALNDINRLITTSSSSSSQTRTKAKIPKSKMNKKLYTKNAKGLLEAPTCCICLTTMKLNDEISQIKCKHLFHYLCLQKWIETKEECPFCRGKLV